jgi:hypothetical protein
MKKRIVVFFVTLFLMNGTANAYDALWPIQVGQKFIFHKYDGANPADTWTSTSEVVDEVSACSNTYYRFSLQNFENSGGTFNVDIRSTENQIYMCESGEQLLEWQDALVGTTWVRNDGWKQILQRNVTVSVPYGDYDNAIEIGSYKTYSPTFPAPHLYEYIVPGVGIVQTIDYWRPNPPWYSELSDIQYPQGASYDHNVYFPHIASDATWETEICLINTDATQTATGSLIVYDNSGNQVALEMAITLAPNARRQIVIGEQFATADTIGYAIYKSDSDTICGYTKFYVPGTYRVAVPATSDINSGDIYVSHIASDANWWTGISLVNTTVEQKTITIEFNDGQIINKTIAGKAHQAFTISSLFAGQTQQELKSAVIKNASGIIGLELFGSSSGSSDRYLSGILLTDQTTTEIYYPHVTSDAQWWTGIVAYNPGSADCNLAITTFGEDGTILNMSGLTIHGKQQYIGTANSLGFPADTAWFSIVSASPISGFELFGTVDGKQLGGYTGVGIQKKEGVFAKADKQGWTGIAFVNTEATTADITIDAYKDDGTLVASESLNLDPYEKLVGMSAQLFSQDISSADYIAFVSSNQIVGFQLNGSSDGMMLDALPAMGVMGGGSSGTENFVGHWSGPINIEGEDRQADLTLDNILTGSYIVTGATRIDIHQPVIGNVLGGTLFFNIPVSDRDVGNTDCRNWNVSCVGFLWWV